MLINIATKLLYYILPLCYKKTLVCGGKQASSSWRLTAYWPKRVWNQKRVDTWLILIYSVKYIFHYLANIKNFDEFEFYEFMRFSKILWDFGWFYEFYVGGLNLIYLTAMASETFCLLLKHIHHVNLICINYLDHLPWGTGNHLWSW